jgi:hypothetical protein
VKPWFAFCQRSEMSCHHPACPGEERAVKRLFDLRQESAPDVRTRYRHYPCAQMGAMAGNAID